MSVNDDAVAGSDSFWEVDQYKRTVKRHEDGFKLGGDLMLLIDERAKLEKDYAKSLKGWNKKWVDLIDKGPEYATMEGAFKGMLQEAESMADVHIHMKDSLLQEVQTSVKQWRAENYHKGMVGHCKETKGLEDEFRKAQKGWAKKMGKVQKTRKEFHTACKLEKTAIHQESNARGDSGVSPDQMKKIQDKVEKCRRDVEHSRDKYEHALRELKDANPKYMEDMTEVFQKSQEFEAKRLQFFKEMLFGVHKCLKPDSYHQIPTIYSQMSSSIDSADHIRDLKWWSNCHGVDMPMHWPVFEEYSPELNTITRKEKKAGGSHNDGVTMTAIRRNEPTQVVAPQNHTVVQTTPPVHSDENENEDEGPERIDDNQNKKETERNDDDDDDEDEIEKETESSAGNPFGEDEEWGTNVGGGSTSDEHTGVTVRAIYDYEGQEDDELTFHIGDVFLKIKDKDEQGWCTGKRGDFIGLYPDNYCEVVDQ